MTLGRVMRACAMVALFHASACSDSGEAPASDAGSAPEVGTFDATGGVDRAGPPAGADALGPETAQRSDGGGSDPGGTCPKQDDFVRPGPGPACHSLPQLGATITPTLRPGQPTAATGGAIRDGIYVLTGMEIFGSSTDTSPRRITVGSVRQGRFLFWNVELGRTSLVTSETAIVGADLNIRVQCTDVGQFSSSIRFTATDDALVLFAQPAQSISTVSTFRRLSCE